ncbi:hypothetical protein [Asanoa iriomotensis]|uniref:hypothetical protein n=1 Tax=Asanoa iriomotensis TaxID=234613 RepID=UPI001942F8D3|nr:hypothetical protein [Asanoa iriomotensis]
MGVQVPPRTHIKDTIDRRGYHLGDHRFWAWLVGHPQADPGVQLGLVAWVCAAEQAEQVPEGVGDGVELIFVHSLRRRVGGCEPCLCAGLDRAGFFDPADDEDGVAARVECLAVASDLGVAFLEGLP